MRKLGLSTEDEFLSETHIGLFSYQNRILDTWIKKFGWVKLRKSQTLVLPRARKTLNTKTTKFWYIRYILRLAKVEELKIAKDEYNSLMYTMSKIQPDIHYYERYDPSKLGF